LPHSITTPTAGTTCYAASTPPAQPACQPSTPNPWPPARQRHPPRRELAPAWRRGRPDRRQLRVAVALLAAAALIATPPVRAGAEWVRDTLGLVELGDPPTRHELVVPGVSRQSYVIATGRAPDGARLELMLDRYPDKTTIADGVQVDGCLTLVWPDTRQVGVHGFCGPGFPPPQNGGRAPGGAPARPFGFLSPYPHATRYGPSCLALPAAA
jgi:hypothetical protein